MTTRDWQMFTVAALILATFFAFYAITMVRTVVYAARGIPTVPINPTFEHFATGLAAFVGTVVAAAFGQELPKPEAPAVVVGAAPVAKAVPSVRPPRERAQQSLARLALPNTKSDWRAFLSSCYFDVYMALGFCAILLWAIPGSTETPAMIKNLATITFGLILGIGKSFFA